MTQPLPTLAAYDSTIQHIELINTKLCRLLTAQAQAENQLIHRVASDYNAGRIGEREVYEIYIRVKPMTIEGFGTRWNVSFSGRLSTRRIRSVVLNLPDSDGNWRGTCPLPSRDSSPPTGQSVVYVLFDAENVPCYVGSTEDFRPRLKAHLRDGKPVVRWLAYPCADREAAYVLETRLLRERKPYLNRRVGR